MEKLIDAHCEGKQVVHRGRPMTEWGVARATP